MLRDHISRTAQYRQHVGETPLGTVGVSCFDDRGRDQKSRLSFFHSLRGRHFLLLGRTSALASRR